MSDWPDEETLACHEQYAYEDAQNLRSVLAPLCEECASRLAAYRVNTTIAVPAIAERCRVGFMRAWREMHAAFKKEWPYL